MKELNVGSSQNLPRYIYPCHFVRKGQQEITWKLFYNRSAPGHTKLIINWTGSLGEITTTGTVACHVKRQLFQSKYVQFFSNLRSNPVRVQTLHLSLDEIHYSFLGGIQKEHCKCRTHSPRRYFRVLRSLLMFLQASSVWAELAQWMLRTSTSIYFFSYLIAYSSFPIRDLNRR